MKNFNKRWLLLIPLILVLAIGGFVLWAATPGGATLPEAIAALASDATVTVDSSPWLVFTPVTTAPTTGFVFYPGGRVLVDAYAPAARQLAQAGYLVVLVPMPLNLAVLGANSADEVVAAYPDIETWAIGGHSLGGAMAANYVKSHPGVMSGLVIWASYPQASDTLADETMLVVASVSGTLDGLAKPAD
ncbi:MAG: alpha/beta hydrolase, partial [Armatimonadetes bacterium]|nr:alpha/beta hydrolase [Anaerolineae bacterium]